MYAGDEGEVIIPDKLNDNIEAPEYLTIWTIFTKASWILLSS